MKSQTEWREAVGELPVFDTHTHMNKPGVPIAAQSVWDIVEYFWFRQEMESVGYPADSSNLPEPERIDRFVDAFARCRNTIWAQVIRETIQELYGIRIHDAASIREADEAIAAKGATEGWPREVIDKLHIKRIVTNIERDVNYPGLPGVGASLPLWQGYSEWTERLSSAEDPREEGVAAVQAIRQDIAGIAERGYRGMRVHVSGFTEGSLEANRRGITEGHQLLSPSPDLQEIEAFLAHAILSALSEQGGMFAQFFLGITRMHGCNVPMGVENDHTVPDLHALFHRYNCDVELVSGSPGMNMDIVQAARIYPNVHAGGLWWCNFRPSTYAETLKKRLEAVPAEKSVILASDGRCIEWCYAKTRLVKRLLADVLFDQVRAEAINEDDALWVAREWLHDAAERRYV